MYRRLNPTDVYRNIRSCTSAAFVLNCVLGLFVCLVLSIIILALIPLYLPSNDFIPASLDNNDIIPTRSAVFINEENWPMVEQTIQNLIHSKVTNIRFTNISDVRLVDSISETMTKMVSIQSKHVSTTWCNTNGCLQISGKITFSVNCPLPCQLRKMNQIDSSNLLDPPIKMNLSSTLNINYMVEFDAFTIVVSENQENGNQVKMFLLYSLTKYQRRAFLPLSVVSVDNSSLVNITRLVSNSIIQSNLNIYKFSVIQAEVTMESSMLNVTVLFTFTLKCTTDCQQIQINKLKNTTSNILEPIVIIYDGNIHIHNVSLADVFVVTSMIIPISTTENIIMSSDKTTSAPIPHIAESIFEVTYKIEPSDLIINGDFQVGPIMNSSTLDELSTMMQTTVSNNSHINVIVFNATIDMDTGNSTTKIQSSSSISYILRLIVYYTYKITCNECVQFSNDAVQKAPVLQKFIQIRNASLIYISRPINVIDINSFLVVDSMTTNSRSTYTVSMSTGEFSTRNSSDIRYNTIETTSVTLVHTATPLTISQHQTMEDTSTVHHSTQHTTHYTTEHTSTSHHTTQHTTTHPHTTK